MQAFFANFTPKYYASIIMQRGKLILFEQACQKEMPPYSYKPLPCQTTK